MSLVLVLGMLMVAVSEVTAVWFKYPFALGEPGEKFYVTEGTIIPFSFTNDYKIPVVPQVNLTGVKVIVKAFISPKVTFSKESSLVSISYTFPQWTHSNYKIIAKGALYCPSTKTAK